MISFLLSALVAIVRLFSISGTMTDANDGTPLSAAVVTVEKDGRIVKWGVSDIYGEYHINGLESGKYTLEFSYVSYKTVSREISLTGDVKLSQKLVPDTEVLNEVTVTAVETKGVTSSTRIGCDAIAHIQPSSFADLLELLPGGIAKDPVLGTPQLINLRSANSLSNSDYATSALGTRFMIDGRPVNNDANMQSTPAFSNYGSSYVNYGTDMREISTEDIDNVEIVRGIASVKYGDLTSGLVNITRKRGGKDLHARFKSDKKSKLFYLGKGFEWGDDSDRRTINASANYLDSRSVPRQTRQNWKRLTSSVRFGRDIRNEEFTKSFSVNLDYIGSFDNQKSDVNLDKTEGGMPIETYKSTYNKYSVGTRFSIKSRDGGKLFRLWEGSASVTYENDVINRWRHVSLGKASPVSTSLEPGEHDAIMIPAKYDATLKVDGRPFYGFASTSAVFAKGRSRLEVGVEWNMDKNYGRGTIFDVTRPFSTGMSVRPRPYSIIPANHRFSAFAEESISKDIGKFSLDWVLGLRAEMMAGAGNKFDVNWKPYLDPRSNLRLAFPVIQAGEYKLVTSIYGGIGRHTKFPTMDMLFPDPILW